jgi:hypothetical protein
MKLMGRCKRCHRHLVRDQMTVPSAVARCPWCGAGLACHYTSLLLRVIPEAECAGRELISALAILGGDATGFELDERSMFGPIERALDDGHDREQQKSPVTRRGRTVERGQPAAKI